MHELPRGGCGGEAVRDLVAHRTGAAEHHQPVDALGLSGHERQAAIAASCAIDRLPGPCTLLWAERGMLDEPTGLYTHRVAAAQDRNPRLQTALVPDTNHFTIGLSRHGAAAVAAAIRDAMRTRHSRPPAFPLIGSAYRTDQRNRAP